MSDFNLDLVRPLCAALYAGDVDAVKRHLQLHPALKDYCNINTPFLISTAAYCGNLEMVKMLVELGIDINNVGMDGNATALNSAVSFAPIAVTRYLLEKGADPNVGRTLFSAISRENEDEGLELVKLLIEHGADKNRVFHVYDDERLPAETPLTFAERQGKQKSPSTSAP